MKRILWASVLVVVVSACGGSDDGVQDADAGANEFTVFGSDDGVVTVQVPNGAAPDDFEATVSVGDPSALGVDTSDLEPVILVYELGPDGAEFDEPVIVVFRISAALGGFDPTMGLPLSLLAIDDGAGGFEPMASMNMSLDGDTLVLEGTTTHFSTATAYVLEAGSIRLVVEPPGLEKSVESLFNALIDERRYSEAVNRIDYSVEGDLEIFSEQDEDATIECVREGEGKIHATVFGNTFDMGGGWEEIFQAFTGGNSEFIGRLSLTIKCVEDADSDVPEPPAEPPPTGHDAEGDQKDTAEEDAGDGVPGADMIRVENGPGAAGEQCFLIQMAGDGEQIAKDANWLDIIVEVDEPDGGEWKANVTFGLGDDPFTDRGVLIGPNAPGRPTLEGATASARWNPSDTLELCVDGGGTNLTVETFQVDVGVRLSNGDTYWDYATGIGSP